MLDIGQQEDGLQVLSGRLKFRDGARWRRRLCQLRRLSPVADTLHLQLFKETPRGLQSKASLSLDNFRAIETGFTLDRESNTLALLCDGSSIVLAFEAREALIQWQVKIAASVPYVQQFPGQLLVAPPRSKLATGSARLHVQDLRVSLVMGAPPRLAATWAIADLRRYGPAEGKYVLEGGSRCGRAEGLHILGLSGGQAGALHAALQEAAQCRLQARRRVNRKQDESPCGMSRRTVSRSCSRDSSIARSRDSGLCRQASLQWSACSSDDCDLSDPAAAASGDVTQRPCGDGQSEVSAGSSGSDSAAGRRPPHSGSGGGSGFGSGARLPRSGSGSALRSPRPVRRCSADCACAVKVSRSSLRRTGVLDGVGEEARGGRGETTPTSPPPGARYADHVYEEPGEKPINGCRNCPRPITTCVSMDRPMSGQDSSPARPMGVGGPPGGRLVRTVAQVHDLDPALAGYDRPRPSPAPVPSPGPPPLPTGAKPPAAPPGTKARLSPEGVSEHLYEDPGPSEGWYQTPRPCTTCRRRQEPVDDGVYRQPACPCAGCGGHGRPVESPRPSVDGTGRMPVMNADTGQLEVPAAGQLCPQIPSEEILDTGLYSQPARPAYAVVDKSRRSGPLLPGLAPPPLPAAAPGPGEPQYANVAPPDFGPSYANCAPMGIDGAGSAAVAKVAAVVVCKEGSTCAGRPPIAPVTAPASASAAATSVAVDGATYVNCTPTPAPPNVACTAYTSTYVNCSPQSSQPQQPLYANEAGYPAACPTASACPPASACASACVSACQPGCPAGNYLPMRPPAGANYLEMDGRTSRSSLRRSRSAESGGQMALRSASLGRRPMPSPKPERLRNLVVTRGPATAAAAAGVEQRSCTLSGDCHPAVTSVSAESAPLAVPRLPLSDTGIDGPEEHQTPLSARSATSASPRVALLSQKPRSGPEYQCLDRSRLLAQMSEPGPGSPATRGCSVDI